MRSIKKLHKAEYRPIADLITYSPMPTRALQMLDPFLFLNHHGPQHYGPANNGLPFGPHPHRGMETVTFILEGDIMHKDSSGHESVITAGGVQWMTAGRGLIHAETSSEAFLKNGGDMEILQLWLNLPAKHKMAEPFYKGLQKQDIPKLQLNDGKVEMNLIAGNYQGKRGAFQSVTDVFLSTLFFQPGGELKLDIPAGHNIFFYVIRGKLRVNDTEAEALHFVEFNNDAETLEILSESESVLLLGHAAPLNEPVVAQGPFVMNTAEEIQQAYRDYQAGKFGSWED